MGLTPPRVILRDVAEGIANQISDDPARVPSTHWHSRTSVPRSRRTEQERLQKEAGQILRRDVLPAMRKCTRSGRLSTQRRRATTIAGRACARGRSGIRTSSGRGDDHGPDAGRDSRAASRGQAHSRGDGEIRAKDGVHRHARRVLTFCAPISLYYTTREELLVAYADIASASIPS